MPLTDSSAPPIIFGPDGAVYIDADPETVEYLARYFHVEIVPEAVVLDLICEDRDAG